MLCSHHIVIIIPPSRARRQPVNAPPPNDLRNCTLSCSRERTSLLNLPTHMLKTSQASSLRLILSHSLHLFPTAPHSPLLLTLSHPLHSLTNSHLPPTTPLSTLQSHRLLSQNSRPCIRHPQLQPAPTLKGPPAQATQSISSQPPNSLGSTSNHPVHSSSNHYASGRHNYTHSHSKPTHQVRSPSLHATRSFFTPTQYNTILTNILSSPRFIQKNPKTFDITIRPPSTNPLQTSRHLPDPQHTTRQFQLPTSNIRGPRSLSVSRRSPAFHPPGIQQQRLPILTAPTTHIPRLSLPNPATGRPSAPPTRPSSTPTNAYKDLRLPVARQFTAHSPNAPETDSNDSQRSHFELPFQATGAPQDQLQRANPTHLSPAYTMQPTHEIDNQYMAFRNQIQAPSPIPHQGSHRNDTNVDEDLDMDAQLENVSPERGGSSLQASLERHSIHAAQSSQKSVHIADNTPPTLQYRNPRIGDILESQSTRRRKAEDYSATSTPRDSSKHTTPSKRTSTLGIDMLSQMWLGFQMHEALLIQRGKSILKELRTDEEFLALGTPPSEIQEFRSLRHAFPRTRQTLYPSERPDAVPGQHLHLTQIPRYENISHDSGLTEGFHITIRFDSAYKQLSRKEVKIACMDRLKLMNIPLGTSYSNPVDIGINTITRNWAGFVKIHLQNPKRDGLALLRGERAFVMAMGDEERIIGKVEKGFELITKARNMRLHLKGEVLCDHSATDILRSIMRDAYYDGREIEILSLTKSDTDKDFAFITLTTEEARADILNNGSLTTPNDSRLVPQRIKGWVTLRSCGLVQLSLQIIFRNESHNPQSPNRSRNF